MKVKNLPNIWVFLQGIIFLSVVIESAVILIPKLKHEKQLHRRMLQHNRAGGGGSGGNPNRRNSNSDRDRRNSGSQSNRAIVPRPPLESSSRVQRNRRGSLGSDAGSGSLANLANTVNPSRRSRQDEVSGMPPPPDILGPPRHERETFDPRALQRSSTSIGSWGGYLEGSIYSPPPPSPRSRNHPIPDEIERFLIEARLRAGINSPLTRPNPLPYTGATDTSRRVPATEEIDNISVGMSRMTTGAPSEHYPAPDNRHLGGQPQLHRSLGQNPRRESYDQGYPGYTNPPPPPGFDQGYQGYAPPPPAGFDQGHQGYVPPPPAGFGPDPEPFSPPQRSQTTAPQMMGHSSRRTKKTGNLAQDYSPVLEEEAQTPSPRREEASSRSSSYIPSSGRGSGLQRPPDYIGQAGDPVYPNQPGQPGSPSYAHPLSDQAPYQGGLFRPQTAQGHIETEQLPNFSREQINNEIARRSAHLPLRELQKMFETAEKLKDGPDLNRWFHQQYPPERTGTEDVSSGRTHEASNIETSRSRTRISSNVDASNSRSGQVQSSDRRDELLRLMRELMVMKKVPRVDRNDMMEQPEASNLHQLEEMYQNWVDHGLPDYNVIRRKRYRKTRLSKQSEQERAKFLEKERIRDRNRYSRLSEQEKADKSEKQKIRNREKTWRAGQNEGTLTFENENVDDLQRLFPHLPRLLPKPPVRGPGDGHHNLPGNPQTRPRNEDKDSDQDAPSDENDSDDQD